MVGGPGDKAAEMKTSPGQYSFQPTDKAKVPQAKRMVRPGTSFARRFTETPYRSSHAPACRPPSVRRHREARNRFPPHEHPMADRQLRTGGPRSRSQPVIASATTGASALTSPQTIPPEPQSPLQLQYPTALPRELRPRPLSRISALQDFPLRAIRVAHDQRMENQCPRQQLTDHPQRTTSSPPPPLPPPWSWRARWPQRSR